MVELWLVMAAVAVLAVNWLLVVTVPWPSLLLAGVWTTVAGLALGLSTGLWYHVALLRRLSAARAVAPRWWLRPAAYHAVLDKAGRRRVLPWFYAGGAGFFLTIAGLALVALATVLALGDLTAPRP